VRKSRKDTEALILKLLNEGCTYREITEIVHCSPNDIAAVRKKNTEENNESTEDLKNKSICTRALDLFQKGISLIDVIIKLDLEPILGQKFQQVYLDLQRREKIVSILQDGKDMLFKIEILEFLQENPQLFLKIKKAIDIQVVIRELMLDRKDAEDDLNNINYLANHAQSRLDKLNNKLRWMEENQFKNNSF
jgi:hypothetical protein